jgi:hypothetical protein
VTTRTIRVALALAGIGAIVVMLSPFGTVGDVVGLVAIILGTVLAAPAARQPRGGWWGLLASGAVLSALGAIVSLANDSAGGVLALVGGVAVLVAAALGWPA